MIAKSLIDVVKNKKTNTRTVTISGIVPQNNNFNNKTLDVNEELSKMYNEPNVN